MNAMFQEAMLRTMLPVTTMSPVTAMSPELTTLYVVEILHSWAMLCVKATLQGKAKLECEGEVSGDDAAMLPVKAVLPVKTTLHLAEILHSRAMLCVKATLHVKARFAF